MSHSKKIFFIVLFIISATSLFAQYTIRKPIVETVMPDSADLKYYNEKHWYNAVGLTVGVNMGGWAFDRYIRQADFAYIDAGTIKKNFKRGFVWDNDVIGTNMFMHPYHGSLYFISARSNGFNFLGSSLYALGGSLMWELFLENEYPSINDAIATPIGGAVFGEILYRSSDMILDDRKTGGERVGREVAAFLVAPTRGLTRLINGEAWQKRATSGRQFGIPNISIDLSVGIRSIELRDDILDEGLGLSTVVSLEYGERFETNGLNPYDYFTFNAHLNIQKGQPMLGQVNMLGRIWGEDLIDNSKDYFNIGAYQYYDYYDSDTISDVSQKTPYRFAAPASFGIGIIHKSKRFSDWDFNSSFHLNGILLGASLSDHYIVDNRNYNLGSGFGWKLGAAISYKDKVGLSWRHNGFRIFTWKGYPQGFDFHSIVDERELNYQGDKSVAALNASNLKLDVKIKNNWYLSSMYSLYRRSTRYKYYEDVYSLTSDGKLLLTYKF